MHFGLWSRNFSDIPFSEINAQRPTQTKSLLYQLNFPSTNKKPPSAFRVGLPPEISPKAKAHTRTHPPRVSSCRPSLRVCVCVCVKPRRCRDPRGLSLCVHSSTSRRATAPGEICGRCRRWGVGPQNPRVSVAARSAARTATWSPQGGPSWSACRGSGRSSRSAPSEGL